MSGLFSHPSAAGEVSGDRPELRVAVVVPASADHAWAGLTEHLHLWWPAERLSRWGAGSFFDLEDNALVETSAQDDENVWGEVTDGEPGRWLELKWKHAGSNSTTSVRLELTHGEVAHPGGHPIAGHDGSDARHDSRTTTLTLVHSGWTGADPQELYNLYREFWPHALGRYRRFMGGS